MGLSVKTGAMIRLYGRFSVHEFEIYRDEQVFPPTSRKIVLNRPNGSSIHIGSIPARLSDMVYVLAVIRDWLNGEPYGMAVTIRLMSEPQTMHALECLQNSLDGRVSLYQEILQAYQEIDPDYRFEKRRNWEQRNVQYHFVGGHLCPAVKPGTFRRDCGKFRLYEVHEHQSDGLFAPSDDVYVAPFYDVCLVISEEEVLRLGEIAQSEVDDAALLAFVDSWIARRERAIQKVKEHLLAMEDPERRARLQRILSRLELSWLTISHAADDLKRSDHTI